MRRLLFVHRQLSLRSRVVRLHCFVFRHTQHTHSRGICRGPPPATPPPNATQPVTTPVATQPIVHPDTTTAGVSYDLVCDLVVRSLNTSTELRQLFCLPRLLRQQYLVCFCFPDAVDASFTGVQQRPVRRWVRPNFRQSRCRRRSSRRFVVFQWLSWFAVWWLRKVHGRLHGRQLVRLCVCVVLHYSHCPSATACAWAATSPARASNPLPTCAPRCVSVLVLLRLEMTSFLCFVVFSAERAGGAAAVARAARTDTGEHCFVLFCVLFVF